MIRVLIVEDRAPLRALIESELEADLDCEIVGRAGSLAEAREMLTTADVVILDLGLPDGCGADLIPELRDANPRARAIVLSASSDPVARTQAMARGAAAVLDKTTHLGQLANTVQRVLAAERL
jgi:DNA-binding NarL/FixJ family response regulator